MGPALAQVAPHDVQIGGSDEPVELAGQRHVSENAAFVIGEEETALFAFQIDVLDVERDGVPAGRAQDPECEVALHVIIYTVSTYRRLWPFQPSSPRVDRYGTGPPYGRNK